jgi:very-long-chain enoyl-CoA reductase
LFVSPPSSYFSRSTPTAHWTDPFPFSLSLSLSQFSEASNFVTHLNTRSLRPSDGSKKRSIPRGYGFNLVSFPNYFFESCVWVGFTIMTGSICGPFRLPAFFSLSYRAIDWRAYLLFGSRVFVAGIFTAVSVGQMLIWAAKKHKNYKKEFGKDYPKGRKAMIPFLF